jgi:D-alanine transaminase
MSQLTGYVKRGFMRGIVYINGQYHPADDAAVSVFDRGFLFGDGVYEMCLIQKNGVIVDEERHLDRFERSLQEVRIAPPVSRPVLKHLCRQIARRNRIGFGHLYYHATRGAAKRDFAFPRNAVPSLLIMAWPAKPVPQTMLDKGVKVITIPEQRWRRVDIKSLNLLAPVLGKQRAVEQGAFEAWQVDERGYVTEGTASNAWIVGREKTLVTHPPSAAILNGVTRLRLLDIARDQGYAFEERPFTVEEARQAAEAFISSTTSYMVPVVRIDDTPVGDGRPGPLSKVMREQYSAFASHHPQLQQVSSV